MDYDSSIDIWSFGCVLAEILLGKPIFQGESTVDQLFQIMKILGIPDTDQLAFLNKNKSLQNEFPHVRVTPLAKIFQNKPKEIISLLQKIFAYEAYKRPSALEILSHPFFDDLRNQDLTQNGKFIFPQIFDFSENEIQLYCSQSSKNLTLLKKIIPDWAESYKLLKE